MNDADALQLAQSVIWSTLILSAPLVLPAMAVGIVIAFFQALTQVQEATLTFVPKMVVVFFASLMAASFMGAHLALLTEQIYSRIATGF